MARAARVAPADWKRENANVYPPDSLLATPRRRLWNQKGRGIAKGCRGVTTPPMRGKRPSESADDRFDPIKGTPTDRQVDRAIP